jgi:hypothetical protein
VANGHGGPRPNSGGARPGAGRKPGAVTTKTREAADRDARADGIEPLALILERMRAEYAARNYDKAAALAVSVLPYRHPRLGQIMPGPADDAPLTDARRAALLVALLERIGGPAPPPELKRLMGALGQAERAARAPRETARERLAADLTTPAQMS